MGEKPDHIVVVAVDGQPCALQTIEGQGFTPLRGQGALAVAGGGVNEHQLWSSSRAEALKDPAPPNRRASERGRTKPLRRTRRIVRTRHRVRPVRPQST